MKENIKVRTLVLSACLYGFHGRPPLSLVLTVKDLTKPLPSLAPCTRALRIFMTVPRSTLKPERRQRNKA